MEESVGFFRSQIEKIILFLFYFLKIFFKTQIDLWRYILKNKIAKNIFILISKRYFKN